MRSPRTLLSIGWLAALLPAQQVAVDPSDPTTVTPQAITEARFDELSELLRPDPEAPWRSIPWRIDLLAAQREAVGAGKPLFIWAMDGHPLGCT